jgi:hypothetical protein
MPEFTITNHIDAPVEHVWEVLDDFGGISQWTSGVKSSALTLHYSYTPNRMGRIAKGTTEKQMRKGISGLADDLKKQSERIAAT